MDRFIIFCVGAVANMASESFWKGGSRALAVLWGGTGMLLLRRIVLRFPCGNRVLLCVGGAVMLAALRGAFLIVSGLSGRGDRDWPNLLTTDYPSASYGLYRFLLIAPAYTIIEYLETRFGM